MNGYTIGEVAQRSGFSASALRYYEGIGLISPNDRTEAGYRVYDERSITRLGFIARAKQLGCSLEEITDLAEIWDGERCGPVQRRFHELVTGKIRSARQQINELTTFVGQLEAAATQLDGDPTDGPCGEDCACVTETADTAPVVLGIKPDDVPIACTLEPGAMSDRIAQWQAVLTTVTSRTTLSDGTLRLQFGDGVDVAQLATDEQHCCGFFSFALTVDHHGVALEARAPAEAESLLTDLFGPAA